LIIKQSKIPAEVLKRSMDCKKNENEADKTLWGYWLFGILLLVILCFIIFLFGCAGSFKEIRSKDGTTYDVSVEVSPVLGLDAVVLDKLK
jgi:hypothetical protein